MAFSPLPPQPQTMCMPLFQRLRAQSLKHLAEVLYFSLYVHARGERPKSSPVYGRIVVSITLQSRGGLCTHLQLTVYTTSVQQHWNNFSEQREREQSVHRHHGANAHTRTNLIIVIGFKQTHSCSVCSLLTKCSQRGVTRSFD